MVTYTPYRVHKDNNTKMTIPARIGLDNFMEDTSDYLKLNKETNQFLRFKASGTGTQRRQY